MTGRSTRGGGGTPPAGIGRADQAEDASLTDEELVLRVRQGDQAAFHALYARYSRRLFSYLCRTLRRPDVAEDVFQEVFMEVLRKDALELRERRFGGWLFTVARNRCLDQLRRAERHAGGPGREPANEAPLATPALPSAPERPSAPLRTGALAPPAEPTESAEEALDRRIQLGRVKEALATLSEAHQDALLLKELAGLSYRQIAEIQAVPEGTAKSRLHFALRAIRARLGAPLGPLGPPDKEAE
jgi:RNA polymerase sigma-70 factor (ECF subfamily)